MNSRIGEILSLLHRAKMRGAKLVGKSALEKELQAIIGAPAIPLPIVSNPGISGPTPETYENWLKRETKG